MKRLISIVLCSVTLLMIPACGVLKSFQQLNEQTEAVRTEIEQNTGSRPIVGWTITNGVLTEVDVYFGDFINEEITVTELKQSVAESVEHHMKRQPKRLMIRIDATTE